MGQGQKNHVKMANDIGLELTNGEYTGIDQREFLDIVKEIILKNYQARIEVIEGDLKNQQRELDTFQCGPLPKKGGY